MIPNLLSIATSTILLAAACGPRQGPEEPPLPADTGTADEPPAPDVSEPPGHVDESPPPEEKKVEQDPGPETILLAENTKQGTVTFGHLDHEDRIACMDCHHEMQDPQGPARSCHDCHNPQATDTFEAKKAFHLQCLGCHKKEARGPATCAGCHAK